MNDLRNNLYLLDILSQPQALRQALAKTDFSILEPLTRAVQAGRFDRILLTGMGASFYGLYPTWLHLAAVGLPAIWVDAAELAHHIPAFMTERSLLWVASQSGRSAEIVSLLRQASTRPPAGLLALTNDLSSPLAQAAKDVGMDNLRVLLHLQAEPEHTPSTRTYLHTLAIGQLAALSLTQADITPHHADLQATADGIAAYLDNWQSQMKFLGEALGRARALTPSIVLVGRGLSLASAYAGALNLQEAAKLPALGLQAAEFRHGPLEMAEPGLTALVFAGEGGSSDPAQDHTASFASDLNHKLWRELCALGANAWLLSPPSLLAPFVEKERGESGTLLPRRGEEGILPIPFAVGIGLPLAEIIPIQLLCVYLSQQAGFTPGAFRHIGKVTAEE